MSFLRKIADVLFTILACGGRSMKADKESLRRGTLAVLLCLGAPSLANGQAAINVNSDFPADIAGGAPNATLQQSAAFAWQEFIALNWPALAGQRDTPDNNQKFGAGGNGSPLVWQTFRSKVEIFNTSKDAQGNYVPPGYSASAPNYGYNSPPA